MQEESFIWGHLEKQHRAVDKWIDGVWLIILSIGSGLLFSINLGGLPLVDGDESTIARVAKEIFMAAPGSQHWLYPTLGGEPYHHKPALIHLLIAWTYSLGGINEFTTRLPTSILSALSVPLLYCVGREIFRQRRAAIYGTLIYLTMLPVVRHGRLAILDGVVVSFFIVMILCLLRSRRDPRYSLGVGIALGLIGLTQGITSALLGIVAIIFIFWDTPRLLLSSYLWVGVFLGVFPLIAWYIAQIIHYGLSFAPVAMLNPSVHPIVAQKNIAPPWYYLLEVFKSVWNWLVFLPGTVNLIWANRNFSWGKLLLVWSFVYLIIISFIGTKLPWYIFPIYPSLALAIGAQLAEIEDMPLSSSYPRSWISGFSILAVISSVSSIYFSGDQLPKTDLQLVFAAVALTMTLAAILAERGDREFLKVLLWGSYISLLLFMKSNYWIWELCYTYPVKPVAAMIQNAQPETDNIYTSFPYQRSSLDFYSDRNIIPASMEEMQYYWHYNRQPYFLIHVLSLKQLELESIKIIDQAESWQLITKQTNR